MTLGERIKQYRLNSKLSQEKVAQLVGVSRQAVTKWEADQSAPSTDNLFKLAEIFNITVDILIADKDKSIQSQAEQAYKLYKTIEEQKKAENRRVLIRKMKKALIILICYFVIYLIGRIIWCDFSESSFLGWLIFSRPEGENSYLFGWLLHQNIYWLAMMISVLFSLFEKNYLSFSSLVGFIIGFLAGILFGPNPEGAYYGNTHYGWAIWGGVFLFSIIIGMIIEKLVEKEIIKRFKYFS